MFNDGSRLTKKSFLNRSIEARPKIISQRKSSCPPEDLAGIPYNILCKLEFASISDKRSKLTNMLRDYNKVSVECLICLRGIFDSFPKESRMQL
mmetsp:Transcript_12968/g.14910  ORF Transcript_12968/g.14910 Transcript_12968/m.14910 type:complete len:94 (+) Transcript_12968:367-648(+)